MNAIAPIAALAAALSAAAFADAPAVSNAINGAFAPDGRRIAFQRHNGNDFDIGIADLESGETVWVEKGPAESAFPSWSRDGKLVYVSHPESETAFVAKKRGSFQGFNVYVWRDGWMKRLTEGREFDSSPAFSRDGRHVYFCSGRGTRYPVSNLWKVDVEGSSPPVKVRQIFFPTTALYGISQPSESPDGRYLLWAEAFWPRDAWALAVCDREQRKSALRLTGPMAPSYAPCWHPQGEYIAFTGYRDGDPGWGIYMMHVRSMSEKRLFAGMNPCISPDGKRILYDDGRDIFIHELAPADFPPPGAVVERADECSQPEKIAFRLDSPVTGSGGTLPRDMRFGTDETVFVRAEMSLNDAPGRVATVFNGRDELANNALLVYLRDGIPWFATRDAARRFTGVQAYAPVELRKDTILTGIRAGGRLYISVDNAPPVGNSPPDVDRPHLLKLDLMPLDRPSAYNVGDGKGKNPFTVRSVEVGRGWPANVPPLASPSRMFGGKK